MGVGVLVDQLVVESEETVPLKEPEGRGACESPLVEPKRGS